MTAVLMSVHSTVSRLAPPLPGNSDEDASEDLFEQYTRYGPEAVMFVSIDF